MPFLKVKNNAESTLAGGISASATSLTVASGGGAKFPTDNFHISIDDEVLLCTSRTDDTFTVQRGKEGTVPAAHDQGAKVQLRWTAAYVEELQTTVEGLQSAVTSLQSTVTALQSLLADRSAAVKRNSAQSIPNATLTAISWQASEWDTNNIWNSSNPTRLTCQTAGRYLCWYQVVFADNPTGGRLAHFRRNGNESDYVTQFALEKDPSGRWRMACTVVINLAHGDYLEVVVWQGSGSSLDIAAVGTRAGILRLPVTI